MSRITKKQKDRGKYTLEKEMKKASIHNAHTRSVRTSFDRDGRYRRTGKSKWFDYRKYQIVNVERTAWSNQTVQV